MTRSTTAKPPHIAAFMDIGTNSMRLLVVRVEPNGSYEVLTQQKELIRLGEGEFESRSIQPQAIERAALVFARFAEMARSFAADPIVAVATSATREARNRRRLLRRLHEAANLDVHVISGREEARLIYLGVASGVRFEGEKALFVDIGGGSTEVIVGDQQDHTFLDTMRLGAIRTTHHFFEPGDDEPITKRQYRRLQKHIRTVAVRTMQRLGNHEFDRIIGSSGTILTLCDIAAHRDFGRPLERDDQFTHKQIKSVITKLTAMPLAERSRVPGMNPRRGDIIIGGAAILDTLLETYSDKPLFASERTLRDGLLIDYLHRTGEQGDLHELSYRMQSVLRLGRKCKFDEDHACHVRRLSLAMFDTAQQAGLHDLNAGPRELLEYAAILHDIGMFVAHSRHRDHTYYLIRHADLLGFDDREIAVIAAAAKYHRKPQPRSTDIAMTVLDEPARHVVGVLSTFLRLAESLDRSHRGNVRDARIAVDDNHAVLELDTAADSHLELWALQGHTKTFARIFGKKLTVAMRETEPPPAVLTKI